MAAAAVDVHASRGLEAPGPLVRRPRPASGRRRRRRTIPQLDLDPSTGYRAADRIRIFMSSEIAGVCHATLLQAKPRAPERCAARVCMGTRCGAVDTRDDKAGPHL